MGILKMHHVDLSEHQRVFSINKKNPSPHGRETNLQSKVIIVFILHTLLSQGHLFVL